MNLKVVELGSNMISNISSKGLLLSIFHVKIIVHFLVKQPHSIKS